MFSKVFILGVRKRQSSVDTTRTVNVAKVLLLKQKGISVHVAFVILLFK